MVSVWTVLDISMEILWLFWTPNICSFSIESCNSIMFILNWPLPKTVHFFANLSVAKLAVLSYMEKGRNLFFCLLLKLRWLTSIFFRWRYKSARSRTTDTQWRHTLCCKSIRSSAFLWCKMPMFRRAGMREGGESLPLTLQYLIFMV